MLKEQSVIGKTLYSVNSEVLLPKLYLGMGFETVLQS